MIPASPRRSLALVPTPRASTRRAALAAFLLFAAGLFVVGPAEASRTTTDLRTNVAPSASLELPSLELVDPVDSSPRFGFGEDLGLLDPEAGPGGFVVFAVGTAQCELTYARNNPLRFVDPDGKAEREALKVSLNVVYERNLGVATQQRFPSQYAFAADFMAARGIDLSISGMYRGDFSADDVGRMDYRQGTYDAGSVSLLLASLTHGDGTGALLVVVTNDGRIAISNAPRGRITLGNLGTKDSLAHELAHVFLDHSTKKTAWTYAKAEARDILLLLTKGLDTWGQAFRDREKLLRKAPGGSACGDKDFVGPCK